MATPLIELLRSLRDDPAARDDFQAAPRDFLDHHGWEHLEPADLREAAFVLADGSPHADAVRWVRAGEAIDADATDFGDGVALAFATAIEPVEAGGFDAEHDIELDADLDEIDARGGEADTTGGHDSADGATDDDADGQAGPADEPFGSGAVGSTAAANPSTPGLVDPPVAHGSEVASTSPIHDAGTADLDAFDALDGDLLESAQVAATATDAETSSDDTSFDDASLGEFDDGWDQPI